MANINAFDPKFSRQEARELLAEIGMSDECIDIIETDVMANDALRLLLHTKDEVKVEIAGRSQSGLSRGEQRRANAAIRTKQRIEISKEVQKRIDIAQIAKTMLRRKHVKIDRFDHELPLRVNQETLYLNLKAALELLRPTP